MDTIAPTIEQFGAGIRQATVSKLESGEPPTQLRILMNALTALDLELVIRPRQIDEPSKWAVVHSTDSHIALGASIASPYRSFLDL